MYRPYLFASLAFASLSLVAGCGDIGSSKGEAGVLDFAIRNEDCFALGCPADHEAVSGSELALDVTGFDSTFAADVKITDPAIAKVTASERACSSANCAIKVKVESRAPGDARLEVWRSGKLVDATTLHFRAPDRVESVVKTRVGDDWVLARREGDAYVVRRGENLVLDSRALSGDRELIAGKGSFKVTYSDPATLGAQWVSNVAASTENLEAKLLGDATVGVSTPAGTRADVRIRVTP